MENRKITGERIKERRKSIGMSAEELAAKVNMSPATIYRYESSDISSVKATKLKPIADVLGVTPAYLMGWIDDVEHAARNYPEGSVPISSRTIPLAGVVGAGECIDFSKEATMESVYAVKGDYALEVGGDSMEPTIMRGDIVTVSLSAEINDGDIAVVQIDDGATIKRVTHLPDGSLLLISDNGHYPPRVVQAANEENCHVQGRVMSIVKEV